MEESQKLNFRCGSGPCQVDAPEKHAACPGLLFASFLPCPQHWFYMFYRNSLYLFNYLLHGKLHSNFQLGKLRYKRLRSCLRSFSC